MEVHILKEIEMLDCLRYMKAKLEEEGFIPTLELAITRLEEEITYKRKFMDDEKLAAALSAIDLAAGRAQDELDSELPIIQDEQVPREEEPADEDSDIGQ